MVMTAGRNVRMAASGYVGIDADGRGRRGDAPTTSAAGFFQQDFQLGFGFDVEEQYARRCAAFGDAVLQSFANFFACFADTGKNDALPWYADLTEAVEFAAADDIETTAQFCQSLQDRQIAIGFNREAQRVRDRLQAAMEFAIGVADGCTAVEIRRRAELFRGVREQDVFAVDFITAAATRCAARLPREVWRKRRGIDEGRRGLRRHAARGHRTLAMTSVRSSESGAQCVKRSTSRRMASDSSVAVSSWRCSMKVRRRSVPKNCPSELLASARPSE